MTNNPIGTPLPLKSTFGHMRSPCPPAARLHPLVQERNG